MELEDDRDALTHQLDETRHLLTDCQTIADHKLGEVSHLETVLAMARIHAEQLQSLQDQTAVALSTTRENLVKTEASLVRQEMEVQRLDAILSALKSSRSWRWTAWLRRLGGKQV